MSYYLNGQVKNNVKIQEVYKSMYGFIYITTCSINHKKYIGKKKYDKNGQWKTYLGSGIILQKAIKKYGKENFTRKIIEECDSLQSLNEREKYWISFYNAVKSDEYYNIADGGDGGNVRLGYSDEEYKKSEEKRIKNIIYTFQNRLENKSPHTKLSIDDVQRIINRLLQRDYQIDIARDFNVSVSTIYDILNHNTWKNLTKDIAFPSPKNAVQQKGRNGKPVVQYTSTGVKIKAYKNARIAEEETGISYKQISNCCNGYKKTAHGFIWKFKNEPFDNTIQNNQ